MNAIQFIQQNGVEKAREVVEGAPVVIDGTDKPFTATHYNYHPRAPIDYINNDGTVIPLCFMEVNFPSYWIDLSDLKRLVESVELIKKHGGLFAAKCQLDKGGIDFEWYGENGEFGLTDLDDLKQAIVDINEMVDC